MAYGTNTNDRSSESPAGRETNRTGWSYLLKTTTPPPSTSPHHNNPATDLSGEPGEKKFHKIQF
ncbi:hypothetical protein AVEN_212367-1, partial [Araneus ventricosus]